MMKSYRGFEGGTKKRPRENEQPVMLVSVKWASVCVIHQ